MTSNNKEASPDIAKAPSDTDSSGEPIFTPPDSEARFPATHLPGPSTRRASPSPLRIASLPQDIKEQFRPDKQAELVDWSEAEEEEEEEEERFESDLDFNQDEDDMPFSSPGYAVCRLLSPSV